MLVSPEARSRSLSSVERAHAREREGPASAARTSSPGVIHDQGKARYSVFFWLGAKCSFTFQSRMYRYERKRVAVY